MKSTAPQMQPRRVRLTRSSEYRNLRHVVPSLRRQRDIGKVEVVTEAARYIDHLHKTLIERFVLCGIPDSLKDVLGTNDANELGSQHIMNLVTRMAASQRQQEHEQRQARQIRRQHKQQPPCGRRPLVAPISARDPLKLSALKRTTLRKDAHHRQHLRLTKRRTTTTATTLTTMATMRQQQPLLAPHFVASGRFGAKAATVATAAPPTTGTRRTRPPPAAPTTTTTIDVCNHQSSPIVDTSRDNTSTPRCTNATNPTTTPQTPPLLPPPVVTNTNNANIYQTISLTGRHSILREGTTTGAQTISGHVSSPNEHDNHNREPKEPHD